MDDAQFWNLIDSTRPGVADDHDAHIEALTAALAQLPESEIVDFDRIFTELWFRAYTWDLWAAAYIIGGGCSDDGFMDFRGWLISRGKKVYEAALVDPQSLLKVVKDEDDECQIEGYQYAATKAWSRRTGRNFTEFPHPSTETFPTDPSGEKWTDDDLPRRFPKLWRRFS